MSADIPTLYYFPTSFYSQKALLALAEKGIPVNKHRVNLGTFENYSNWFMKLNPKGQVPVLVDEGKVIPDSSDIIGYADKTYEGPVLMPEMGKEKWSEYQKQFEDIKIEVITYGGIMFPDLVDDCHVPEFIQNKMRGVVKSGKRSAQLKDMMAENPDMLEIYQKKFEDCGQFESTVANRDAVVAEIEKVQEMLTRINTELTDRQQEWLCGPDLTISDICLAILLHRLNLVGLSKKMWIKQLPMVKAYYERLLYRKTFRQVCVEGTSTINVNRFGIGSIGDWLPIIISAVFLVVSITLGYQWIWGS